MSYCKEEGNGKDRIIFATKEDLETPSKAMITVNEDEDQPAGLILPNGDINWDCPCLGGMASGPCGVEFRESFTCFHYSEAEPKASDCFDKFMVFNDCLKKHADLYPDLNDEDEEELKKMEEAVGSVDDQNKDTDNSITSSTATEKKS